MLAGLSRQWKAVEVNPKCGRLWRLVTADEVIE